MIMARRLQQQVAANHLYEALRDRNNFHYANYIFGYVPVHHILTYYIIMACFMIALLLLLQRNR